MPIKDHPKDEMFIWGYWKKDKFRLGLAYHTVSKTWADAYGDRSIPLAATHCMKLPDPPRREMFKICGSISDSLKPTA
jgi:hypothetical protein